MKRTKVILTMLLTLCFCCAFFVFPILNYSSYAQSNNEKNINTYTESGEPVKVIKNTQSSLEENEMDSSLFIILNKLAYHIRNNGDYNSEFDADVFNVSAHSSDASYYSPSSDSGEEILEDLRLGVLDLTGGINAKYKCLKDNPNAYNIKDITGLNSLNLNNITTLKLDNNSLTEIAKTDLSSLNALRTFSATNNNIKTFELNDSLGDLHQLILSNNKIEKIDISKLSSYNNVLPKVDLSFNNISNLQNITFSNLTGLSSLDISFNNLNNLTNTDIQAINSHLSEGNKANILLQSATSFSNLYAGDKISIYQEGILDKFQIKFFYSNDSSFYNEDNINPICQNFGNKEMETIFVPAGKIKIEFYSNNIKITNELFMGINPILLQELTKQNEYNIALKSPTYKIYSNNKQVNSLEQGSDIKVVLNIDNIENIPNKRDVESENGAKYLYNISNKTEVNSNTIEVKTNGKYVYFAYLSFDGINSEKIRLSINRHNLSGITWGIVVIVVIFVVCAALYFILRWFKNGAEIAPLSDKEIYRLRKRKRVLTETSNDDYISSLDAPRHATRVSDQVYSDDMIEENLNESNSEYSNENTDNVNNENFPDDIS